MKIAAKFAAGLAIIGLLGGAAASAQAQGKKSTGTCVDKCGKGWGGDKESARFQAWEAVLQDTSWAMWGAWISTGAKIGTAASGYSVSNVRERCSKEGSQTVCIMRAKLCQ